MNSLDDIPIMPDATIAITVNKLTETIVIENKTSLIEKMCSNQFSFNLIWNRPVGSLLNELNYSDWNKFDSIINLADDLITLPQPNSDSLSYNELYSILLDCFKSDSILYKYFAIKVWNDYLLLKERPKKKRRREKIISDIFFISEANNLYYPLKCNITNHILDYQNFTYLDYDLPTPDIKQKFIGIQSSQGYYFAVENSLLPFLYHYIMQLNINDNYVFQCMMCGNIFVKTNRNRVRYCKSCKGKRTIDVKKKYDERNKDNNSEKIYNSTKAFWHYRLKSLKNKYSNASYDSLNNKYLDFKTEGVRLKKNSTSNQESEKRFIDWCFKQQNLCQQMFEDITIKGKENLNG